MIELGIARGPDPTERRIVFGADSRRDRSGRARRRFPGRGLGALGGVRDRVPVLGAPGDRHGRTAQPTHGRADPADRGDDHQAPGAHREYLAVLDVRDGRLALDEAWEWFVTGRPRRDTWRYRVTQSGPSFTETRTLPADEVCHVRYAWYPEQPWRGASPAAFAVNGAGLAGGIDTTLAGEANSASGYVMPAADLGADAEDDDVDPFAKMRAELASLARRAHRGTDTERRARTRDRRGASLGL